MPRTLPMQPQRSHWRMGICEESTLRLTRNLAAGEGRNDLEQRESATCKKYPTPTIEGWKDKVKKEEKATRQELKQKSIRSPRPRDVIGKLLTRPRRPAQLHPSDSHLHSIMYPPKRLQYPARRQGLGIPSTSCGMQCDPYLP